MAGLSGDALEVRGGRGGTVARLEDLDRCAAALRSAAEALEEAWWALARIQLQLDAWGSLRFAATSLSAEGEAGLAVALARVARSAVEPLRSGPHGTLALASGLRGHADLVARTRTRYASSESFVTRYVRGMAQGVVTGIGLAPGGPLALLAGLGVVLRAEAILVLAGQPVPGDRAEQYINALANAMRGLRPGPQLAVGDPVPEVSAWAALLLHKIVGRREVTATPVIGSRTRGQPPRGVSDLVASFNALGTASGGKPGNGDGVRVTSVRRADGSKAWSVTIPGTQGPGVGTEEHPFDNLSNLELTAGIRASSTTAVLAAMAQAGVGADEPVVLTGHSQGGLVAQQVASSGGYAVAAVLTLGSPTGTRTMRSGVPTLHLESSSDLVPGLDGKANPDDPLTTTVTYTPEGAAAHSPIAAHETESYADLAALVDESEDASIESWREAMTEALGADGEATSRVYAVQRLDTER